MGEILHDNNFVKLDSHPEFFQWHYFDFCFDNGDVGSVVFLSKSPGYIEGVSRKPLTPELWLSYTRRNGRRFDHKRSFAVEKCRGIGERLNIRVEDNCIWFDGSTYNLQVKGGGIEFNLTLTPSLPPWTPVGEEGVSGEFLSPIDPAGKTYFHYIEYVPRGDVRGEARIEGSKISLTGLGYHEVGTGNFSLFKVFEYWGWLKFWIGNNTLIIPFGHLSPELAGAEIGAVFFHRNGELIYDLFDIGGMRVKTAIISKSIHKETGRKYPSVIEFDVMGELKGVVKEGILVEEVKFNYLLEDIQPPPIYLRFLSSVEGEYKGEPIKGEGMHEIMLAR